jgi:hypothetical protein
MDTLTFISSLVGSIAWPVTILGVILLLRKEVTALLPLLRRLKAGPVEAEFERDVQELRAESVTSLPATDIEKLSYRWKQALELAQISPRAAVLDAWQNVEFAARRAVLHHAGSPIPDVSTALRVIRELSQMDLLSEEQVALFHELRGLRNQATHAPDFSPSLEAAINYVKLAASLESHLEGLTK